MRLKECHLKGNYNNHRMEDEKIACKKLAQTSETRNLTFFRHTPLKSQYKVHIHVPSSRMYMLYLHLLYALLAPDDVHVCM